MRPTIALIGCGNRGADVYGALLPQYGASVAWLVEPDPARLAEVAARHSLTPERCFTHWKEFFSLGRVADAVVIATPDHQHVDPGVAALALGYDVLLEKPICLHETELDVLLQAEAVSEGRVSVCHVLRATPFFRAVQDVIESGRLGQLIGLQHAENVAFWHYAHSYVRGNWRQSPPAAPFLLAKSCHDLDLLRWFAQARPQHISSEGGLRHFHPQHAPVGAASRCVACEIQDCPYDARRIYSAFAPEEWPTSVVTAGGVTLEQALREGPYGECVYLGKNNVVDHQALTATFENGVSAQLTVSAFTHNNTRTLKVLGSHGELRAQMDYGELEVHDFRTGQAERWTVASAVDRHGGGDAGLIEAWLRSVRREADVPTPLAESLDSHRMAFAAERARLKGTVEHLGAELEH